MTVAELHEATALAIAEGYGHLPVYPDGGGFSKASFAAMECFGDSGAFVISTKPLDAYCPPIREVYWQKPPAAL